MSDQVARIRRGGRIFLLTAIAVGALFLVGRAGANLYTEILWYRSVGYESVLWTRIFVDGGMRVVVGLAAAILAFFNFRLVARTLGGIQIKRRFGNLEIAERIPKRTIRLAVAAVSAFLGLWIGAAFPGGAGLRFLLFLRAPAWGLEVPPFGQDASFFVFTLPVLGGALVLGLALIFLFLSFSAAGYAATGSIAFKGGKLHVDALPRKHLLVLVSLFLLLLTVRFWLAPFFLALHGNSGVQGILGYADANARVPGYHALALLTLSAAGVTWWFGLRQRWAPVMGSWIAVVLGGLVLLQLYPQIVQRFQVEPNELSRETPFIQANLRFTRIGFGLDHLQRSAYPYDHEAAPDWGEATRQFAGLPIWTRGALLTTFGAVEAIRRYYNFEDVAIDRYSSPIGVTPTAVSVREVDPSGIEDPNWQNLHLRATYQAGMGAVASAANRRTPQGRPPMFLSGIPPVPLGDPSAPPAMRLNDPSVYFSARSQPYAVVNPDSLRAAASGAAAPSSEAGDSLQASVPGLPNPRGSDTAGAQQALEPVDTTALEPPAGIRLDGPLRRLALAWRFGDANLVFTSEITRESLFVFRRRVVERAAAVAPFLSFPEAPYPVLTGGRIMWILEGFTATRNFPLSTVQQLGGSRATSYLRNSVKVTVDAVTGEIRMYRVVDQDPMLDAWSKVFPALLRPIGEMPPELREHIRYPQSLFDLQSRVLQQYHQETATRFHRQQDVWALAQELEQNTRPVAYIPEYGSYRLPGEQEPEFLLSTVFVPAGRQNLAALFVARCDPDHYGELLLLDVPVDQQVPGPRQVEALVEQDPVISQQFSLWRQGGSQVWSGHLHVVPVGRTLLYVEPIFLAAEADAIPELRRFVVSDGRRVAMEPSLEATISALASSSLGALGVSVSPSGVTEPSGDVGGHWSSQALDLLDQAEARLRQGDWTGFGQALEELRSLLQSASGSGGGG